MSKPQITFGGGSSVGAIAKVDARGAVTRITITNAGSGYATASELGAWPEDFERWASLIREDFGEMAHWARAIDVFRALAKFALAPHIEVAGHNHGLIYHPDVTAPLYHYDNGTSRPEMIEDANWIIWRAHEDRYYTGERGALLAGAGIPLDLETT